MRRNLMYTSYAEPSTTLPYHSDPWEVSQYQNYKLMISIGIRVMSAAKVYYTILESSDDGSISYVDVSHLSVPSALDTPEQLNFVRNTLLDILLQYNVTAASIRLAERSAFGLKNTAIERYFLEGVIQECLASSRVKRYIAAKATTFSRLAGWPGNGLQDFAQSKVQPDFLPELPNWKKLTVEPRESVLTAYVLLSSGR